MDIIIAISPSSGGRLCLFSVAICQPMKQYRSVNRYRLIIVHLALYIDSFFTNYRILNNSNGTTHYYYYFMLKLKPKLIVFKSGFLIPSLLPGTRKEKFPSMSEVLIPAPNVK